MRTGSRSNSENWEWNKGQARNWKGESQGYILSPACLTYMQSTSCKTPGRMNHKLGSRLLGETSTTSDMQSTTLMGEIEGELKDLLMRMKEEGEKLV